MADLGPLTICWTVPSISMTRGRPWRISIVTQDDDLQPMPGLEVARVCPTSGESVACAVLLP